MSWPTFVIAGDTGPRRKMLTKQMKEAYTEVAISSVADPDLFEHLVRRLVTEFNAALLNHVQDVDTDFADLLLENEKLTLHRQTFIGISVFPTELGKATLKANALAEQVGLRLREKLPY